MYSVAARTKAMMRYDTGPAHWLRDGLGIHIQAGGHLCFVLRLVPNATSQTIEELYGLAPLVKLAQHEKNRLARLQRTGDLGSAEVFAYVPEVQTSAAVRALDGIADPLEIMAGTAISDPDAPAAVSAEQTQEVAQRLEAGRVRFQRKPVFGIVDDEIGYLNARFCRRAEDGGMQSRVEAIWIQHPPVAGLADMESGPVLRKAQIDAMLADVKAGAVDEISAYSAHLPASAPQRMAAVTHGTHVMDLAAGFEPDDDIDIPIFAVDMPRDALSAPQSERGVAYLVQGSRWLVQSALDYVEGLNARALAQDDGTSEIVIYVPDIVMNCSIGSFSGPKDGSGVFARMIGRDLELVNKMRTDPALGEGYSYRATLFQSFGNAFGGAQSAFHAGQRLSGPMDWVLPRADKASSRLDIWVSGGEVETIWLRIGAQDLELGGLKPHRYRDVTRNGQVVLRLYREADDAHGRQLYRICVRPTKAELDEELEVMPAGALRIAVQTVAEADVLWQVQRDDVPFGYHGEGKQSHLRDPLSAGYAPQTRSWDAPQSGSAVLTSGTETAEAHSPHPNIVTVGAVVDSGLSVSGYSASGSDDPRISHRKGPDISATGDDGGASGGVVASGTVSGSFARLSGTSIATPQAARRALLSGDVPVQTTHSDPRRGPVFEDRSGAISARHAE